MELNAIQKQPLIKNDRFSSQERVWRGVFFISLAVASLIFLISRLFVLQIVKGSYYETVSDENRIRAEVLKAYRGVIKDREGRILAQNSPSFNIKINKNVSNYSEIIKKLSIFIDTSSPVSVGEFTIFGNVNRDTAIKIEAGFFGSFAVAVETAPQRDYLYPEELAHLLGYVSFISSEADDRVGVIGVEKFYDIYLRGSHGSLLYEYDAKGSILREIARKEPVNGKDLTISIDLDLQLKSYEALKKAVEETGATGGVVVAQNPKNGEILALVSLPSFNPNLFSRGISSADYNKIVSDPLHPMFNRALLGQYPPGSVFKIVTASAVLEEGVVTADTKVLAPGAINVGSFVYRDWNPAGHGEVNIIRALAESADTFFYKVVGGYSDFANNLGPEKLASWAKKFGLGSETGIGFDDEEKGIIPDPLWKKEVKDEPWYIGDSYITAIGQGDVLTTPIQVNQMTSVIANGGYLISPKIVRGQTPSDKSDNSDKSDISDESNTIISKEVFETVKQGLKEACEAGGTGYPFFDFATKHSGIKPACKTGTSEFGQKNSKGEYQTHAWFVVFAPVDNAQIVLTVFLEGGGGGADIAAPVAREILDFWFD